MRSHAKGNARNSQKVGAASAVEKKTRGDSISQFMDNRAEATAHKQLQTIADASPQVRKIAQMQAMANIHSDVLIQKREAFGEKLVQTRGHARQKKNNDTALPDHLKAGIESLSGMSMDDVKVHRHSTKPAQLQARAYAQGNDIYLGSGQEQHLPHEAWHVVQQKQGRVKPTAHFKGEHINDDEALEHEADSMGAKADSAYATHVGASREKASQSQLSFSSIQRILQRKIGPGYSIGKFIVSKRDYFYRITEADDKGYTNEDAKGRETWIDAEDVVYDRTDKTDKDLKAVDIGDGWSPWVLKDNKDYANVEKIASEVKVSAEQANSIEYTKLAQYQRINVIDLGGPGTGHQAAVIKLLASIASVGFSGQVVLNYNARKTRIYANKFGMKSVFDSAQDAYNLYHKPWKAVYPLNANGDNQLKITCYPLAEVKVAMTNAEQRVFGNKQIFWTQYAWPGAKPKAFTEEKPNKGLQAKANWSARQKWSASNGKLDQHQRQFRQKIFDQETGAGMVPEEALGPLEKIKGSTLTAFGAMDFHPTLDESQQFDFKTHYFQNHWVPKLQEMTGEKDPVAIIMQPFLWSGGHPMQVRGGGKQAVNVSEEISKVGGKASYRWVPPEKMSDDKVIGSQPPLVQAILNNAKAGTIHLISAYYGGAVSDIKYSDLLKVLVKVFKIVKDDKPVTIALIGDEDKTAHKDAAREINDPTVGAKESAEPTKLEIELAHIGRTTAMAQFQRYSELFITEGANTWQEVLTLGTPALSAGPGGNTQPWKEDQPGGNKANAAKKLVENASKALIGAQKAKDINDKNINTLVEFIKDIRSDKSIVKEYFMQWSVSLQKSASDQVVTALRNLPNPNK